ncbi:DUF3592 domain-containing protein [Caballeronia pedi]|uniref:DUF3592 domain-containing protein n=1 Tax=Caballeronia pedi TaxID=1777141 RepID=UPI000B34D501|nr:DUF3592 domain-containing protein [Caballeronia pedi]
MTKKRFDLASLGAGVFFLVVQLPLLVPEVAWYRHSTLTAGVVVGLNAGGKHPQIEFTARSGERISVPASSFFHFTQVGEQVLVRYDTRSPAQARINGVVNIWGGFIVFTAVAFASIIRGLFRTYRNIKTKNKE